LGHVVQVVPVTALLMAMAQTAGEERLQPVAPECEQMQQLDSERLLLVYAQPAWFCS